MSLLVFSKEMVVGNAVEEPSKVIFTIGNLHVIISLCKVASYAAPDSDQVSFASSPRRMATALRSLRWTTL